MTILLETSSSSPLCLSKMTATTSPTDTATSTPLSSFQSQIEHCEATRRDEGKRGQEVIAEVQLVHELLETNNHDDLTTIHCANKLAATNTVTSTICRNDEDEIMTDAELYVQSHWKKSRLLGGIPEIDQQPNENATKTFELSDDIPKVKDSELIMGEVLGHGGFCIVHEVRLTKPLSRDNSFDKLEDITNVRTRHHENIRPVSALSKQNGMKEMKHHFSFNPAYILAKASDNSYSTNAHYHHVDVHYPYALKRIDPRLYQNIHRKPTNKKAKQKLVCGIADLVLETQYLSKLNHPHIIQVRGISSHSPYNYHTYYMLLDKLSCMLTQKIHDWKRHHRFHHPNPITHLILDLKRRKENACFYKRLRYAYDIATAIDYLHQNNIIYRDIKPDNIGFDMMDEIKLTDFGLIKEINPIMRDEDGLFYNISDIGGSYYYMDPRAALGLSINESCDVYSFCILLWQILKLEQPFESFTHEMLKYNVFVLSSAGERPEMCSKWSHTIRDMMGRGWSYDYKIRPTMKEICHILHEEIERYYQNHDHDNHHIVHAGDDACKNRDEVIQQTTTEIEL